MSPDFGGDPEQAERAVQKWSEGLREKAAQFTAMRQQIDAIRVTESSRSVAVTVNSEGVPIDVRFGEQSRSMTGAELSREFMAVLHRAQSKIADQVAEATRSTVGEQSSTGAVIDAYRKRFPQPPGPAANRLRLVPDPPPPSPPAAASRPQPDSAQPGPAQPHTGHDDGDFSDETFLR
ncbi:hypothetical protein MOQ72_24140 [Saccharopolyspora sp. K220]|uniref:hypothetical protein n=1 Tax=Saccharopolyspora soli TaxID=2926618 RepID=UPI001F587074|nr:hypothetical protein [Saccharopolyspora soli]MCI2420545.1 hypothetical protein [Saccharopolyspora soli]